MKVLIVGGYNVFVRGVIEKFNKEGWEVYLLTGNKNHTPKHTYVFEQYDFPYDSDSIKEIIDSASPDLVLFTGAYDGNFSAQSTRRESMYYMSGLVNILMASQMLNVPRFVYISSHEVYEESYKDPVREEETSTPVTTKGMIISQGENLVARYGETTNMDTLILRLDHMYWLPKTRGEIEEIHAKLCLHALRDRKIPGSAKHIFSSVYITDAIFAIYEIVKKNQHRHNIYNITTGEEENEIELAKIIRDVSGRNIVIKDNTIGITQKNVMSGERMKEEFGILMRYNFRERTKYIMEYMDKNRNDFLKREERTGTKFYTLMRKFEQLFYTMLPFLENGVVFIFVFLLNNRTADNEYFRRLDVFLLYVVLFAVFYGKRQAILSAFFSTVGFIFRQSYYRTGVEVLVDYNIYIWMAQLFIVGMGVGHLRDAIQIISDDKDEEIAFLSSQLEDIYDINSSNLKVKNILEDHIIAYDDSLGTLENLTARLENIHAGEIMFETAEILSKVLGTKDVAIYKVSNDDFCRLLIATTENAKRLGKSLKYSSHDALVNNLKRGEVFVNKNFQEDLPIMAYGLRGEEKLEYIFMIWNLPFERMSLHQMNLFKVIGNMVHNALNRSDAYMEAVSEKRHYANTNILNKEAFCEMIEMSRETSKRRYADSALIRIESVGKLDDELRNEEKFEYFENILSKNLRETDTIGIGEDGFLYVLLSNSNENEAETVIQRFARQGIVCVLKESF